MNNNDPRAECEKLGLVRGIKEAHCDTENYPHGLNYQVVAYVNNKTGRYIYNDWTCTDTDSDKLFLLGDDGESCPAIFVDSLQSALTWVMEETASKVS